MFAGTGSACHYPTMTKQQLYLFGCLYLVILAVVAVLTRASPRRIAGALVGGAVAGVALLGIVAIGENAGWWHMAVTWEPYFLTLMWIGTLPCGFIFLITWRIARRFGGRGLAVVAFVAAVLGRCGTTAIWQPSRSGAPTRQGLHPCLQVLWRMSSWGYWATERCGWSPALPRQTGWRAGRGNRPDTPSFENGTPNHISPIVPG